MRRLPARLATAAAMALAIALCPSSWAQEGRGSSGQDEQKHRASHPVTIRGIVAGVTAEGELVFDYRHNRAVEAEAAFLTVVGSPVRPETEKGEAEHREKARGEQHGKSGRKRHDIYIVWLSPRTKICECTEESGRKKECGLDQVEVGDQVEIQFNRREESGERHIAHQSERMRLRHGRHRTHVGYATEVTILVPREAEHPRSGSREKEGEKESSK